MSQQEQPLQTNNQTQEQTNQQSQLQTPQKSQLPQNQQPLLQTPTTTQSPHNTTNTVTLEALQHQINSLQNSLINQLQTNNNSPIIPNDVVKPKDDILEEIGG